jgi:hypothetical protein
MVFRLENELNGRVVHVALSVSGDFTSFDPKTFYLTHRTFSNLSGDPDYSFEIPILVTVNYDIPLCDTLKI